MKDIKDWTLANNFENIGNTKVGDTLGKWTILGFWVDHNKLLKFVKVQCSCSFIDNFCNPNILKPKISNKCPTCSNSVNNDERLWLIEHYGIQIGNKLWRIWSQRAKHTISRTVTERRRLHPDWLDIKVFAAYVVQLDNFDLWPTYEFNRINNDQSYGYAPGNVNFVSHKDNMRNKNNTMYINYRKQKYAFANFVELITGSSKAHKIYSFIYRRIRNRNMSIIQALNDLYARRNLSYFWPSLAVKEYFLSWYGNQIAQQVNK